MMPRLKPLYPPHSGDESAFARGAKERPLRLVLDRESIGDSEAANVLAGFGRRQLLEVVSTRDEGLSKLTIDDVRDDIMTTDVHHPDGSWSRSGVPFANQYEEIARRHSAKGMGDEQALLQQLLLVEACGANRVDALVTNSAYLLAEREDGHLGRRNLFTPEEAASVVGLWLRSRNDFTVDADERFVARVAPSSFYLIVARELLPEWWRWFSACARAHDDTLTRLGGSAITRLANALRARDRLLTNSQLQQEPTSGDEILFYLDVVLLMAVGAFDVVARVADHIYGIAKPRSAGWSREGWRVRLSNHDPGLAGLVEPGQPHRNLVDLIALLRNSIHGEALRVGLYRHGRDAESRIMVPEADHQDLLDLVSRCGGADAWGVRPKDGAAGDATIDARVLVETLLVSAALTLNALMEATAVEKIAGVKPGTLPEGPPVGDEVFWSPEKRGRISLLAGLP